MKGVVDKVFAYNFMNQVDTSINHRRAQNFMEKHKEFPGAFR